MAKFEDLTGRRFGRLVVQERAENYRPISEPWTSFVQYVCRCDCGEVVNVLAQNLRNGKTQSCGCLRRETMKKIGEQARKRRAIDD